MRPDPASLCFWGCQPSGLETQRKVGARKWGAKGDGAAE